MGGEDDDLHLRALGPSLSEKVDAVQGSGHPQIGDHDPEGLFGQLPQGFDAVGRLDDGAPFVFQGVGQIFPDAFLVVHDKNGDHFSSSVPSGSRGIRLHLQEWTGR